MSTQVSITDPSTAPLLGEGVPLARMPAHWMLARLGKKVMRPGGLTPSLHMLEALRIGPDDDVVDMWPGLGVTTRRTLAARPRSYTAIERGAAEAARVQGMLHVLARPLTSDEWRQQLEDGGFEVDFEETGEMLLLDVPTFLSDEGLRGSAAFTARCLAHPSVLPRIAQMWTTFRRYRDNIGAVVMTARRS